MRPALPPKRSAVALLVGALALVAAGAVVSQEGGLPGLRGPGGAVGPAGSPGALPSLGAEVNAPPGDPARSARPGRRRTAGPRLRRTRPPAAARVQAFVRTGVISPRVAPEVETPLVGLPDPSPPPETRRRRRPPETDPYASLGLRAGNVLLFPSVEQATGYDTNPNQVARRPQGSLVHRTEGRLRVESDWPVHALTGQFRGTYSAFPDAPEADRPEAEGDLTLRLDARRDLQLELGTRFNLDSQRPGSPDLDAAVSNRPLVTRAGLLAGATKSFNRVSLRLRGTLDRSIYEDALLRNGGILDQSDRNDTQVEGQLRAGYDLSPGFQPFVQGEVDTRIYDRRIDNNGFARRSAGTGIGVGSAFELTRFLTGEALGGYEQRTYEDPRLQETQGPLVEAALLWTMTPLTSVRLNVTSRIEETTVPGSSGVLSERATLEVRHDLRRNVSLIGSGSLYRADYRGTTIEEEGVTLSAKVECRMTRSVAVRAEFTHDRLRSSEPTAGFTQSVFLLGLRFQP